MIVSFGWPRNGRARGGNHLARKRAAASCLAGDEVKGPFSAYCQAKVIDKHSLNATGGKHYAELGQDDPLRQTAMTASFLQASLFTSVVAYGFAGMAVL